MLGRFFMSAKGIRICCCILISVIIAITVGYLFMDVAYIKNLDGGIRGITAIFGGRETFGKVITLDFNISVSGVWLMILLCFSVFLLVRSVVEGSYSLLGVCGGLLIACAIFNYLIVSRIEAVGETYVDFGVNPIAYIYSILCLMIGLICFSFSFSSKKNK